VRQRRTSTSVVRHRGQRTADRGRIGSRRTSSSVRTSTFSWWPQRRQMTRTTCMASAPCPGDGGDRSRRSPCYRSSRHVSA
jgi:hypothetical protein